MLKYAYPREVEENPDYHSSVTAHFLSEPNASKEHKKRTRRCQSDSDVLSSSSSSSNSSSIDDIISPAKDIKSIHSVSVGHHLTYLYIMMIFNTTTQLASKAGHLVKMGAKVKVYTYLLYVLWMYCIYNIQSWKRRWFVLKDRYLSYYAKETVS